jgi:hypothetical protein
MEGGLGEILIKPSRAELKKELRYLLGENDPAKIENWIAENTPAPIILSSLLFDADEEIIWRAVAAFGAIAARDEMSGDIERPREIIRRMLWGMNDESGNLIRRAPEVIGEILYNAPSLIPEFAPLLPAYLDEEPFERGAFWAVARVAERDPSYLQNASDRLRQALNDPDNFKRAQAAKALAALEKKNC